MNKYEKLIREYSIVTNEDVARKLQNLASQKELPTIVKTMLDIAQRYDTNSDFNNAEIVGRVEECRSVLYKVAELAQEASISVIQGALNGSVGRGAYKGSSYDGHFLGLNYKSQRQALWGTKWQLPCFMVNALIMDILSGIDANNPEKEELLRSELLNVLVTFGCPKEKLETFINENY